MCRLPIIWLPTYHLTAHLSFDCLPVIFSTPAVQMHADPSVITELNNLI